MMPARSLVDPHPPSEGPFHAPVLVREALELLAPRPGAVFVDATVGLGGHAEPLLAAVGPTGRVIGLDRDADALSRARERLGRFGSAFVPVHARHEDLAHALAGVGLEHVDGVLFDLGVSSLQLDDPRRGFAFRLDGPLDMRMDASSGATAADLVAACSAAELRRILSVYGEERKAGAIAREIVRERERRPITRTAQLAALVERVSGAAARRFAIHPATRTFQALRIAVNGEIDGLARAVSGAVALLAGGGRLVVISYHSLEDRAAKRELHALAHRCTCPPRLPLCACGRLDLVRLLTSRALRPGAEEIARNPRSRSARLRAAERL